MQDEKKMTNKQSERMELLARIDELDRLLTTTTDQNTMALIEQRKAKLRERLDAL